MDALAQNLFGGVIALLMLAPAAAADELKSTSPVMETVPASDLSADDIARRNRNMILGSGLLVGWYGSTHWWKDGLAGDFHTVHEGWFGPDTYAGGADKLGHLFIGYAGTRLLARSFEGLGNDPDRALWLGAATTLGTLAAIETVDGFSKKWRFSIEDMVMNTAGTGLGILFERSPALDRLLDFRLMYRPSGAARQQGSFDPIGDYSGQTYLLVLKAAGISGLREYRPLRYLELAAGYGSRGYESNDVSAPSRHAYLGISLNLSEIFDDTLFSDSRGSRARRVTRTLLKFVQVPGTAVALKDHAL